MRTIGITASTARTTRNVYTDKSITTGRASIRLKSSAA